MYLNTKSNSSYLFSSMNQKNISISTAFSLGDYASIKNGSYKKALTSYFKNTDNSSQDSLLSNKTDSATTLSSIQESTSKLSSSADALRKRGTNSETTLKNVKSFVEDYNKVIQSTENSKTSSVQTNRASMISNTKVYESLLNDIGITINSDNTLSLSEETFKAADEKTVNNLFQSTGSFGYHTSLKSSQINYGAKRESEKVNTYNNSATINNSFSAGNIYNSYF